MKEIIFNISIILGLSIQIVQADVNIRNCTKEDLIGTWKIDKVKVLDEIAEQSHYDLMQPYQIRIYKQDNTLWSATSNNDLTKVVKNLSKFPQGDTYDIKKGVVITLKNEGTKIADTYKCDYFVEDYKQANIKQGSIGLMWFKNNKPIIANTYTKLP